MRIAIISDIHANIVALDAFLSAIGTVDRVWQLGDIVGYGPEPDAVAGRLMELGATGVRGNHDAAALGGSEIDFFNVDARRAMEWTRSAISAGTRAWLETLPERHLDGQFDLAHGSPRDPIWEYVTTTPVARLNFDRLRVPNGLIGHTHLPAVFRDVDGRVELMTPSAGSTLELDGRRMLANPGSIGQPRDGDPRASGMVLDLELGRLTWHRVPYDVGATQAAMRRLGLPGRLVDRLTAGL